MWIFLALFSGLASACSGLIHRHLLKGKQDAWTYSFYFSFIGTLVTAPFFLLDIKVEFAITNITFLGLIGLLIVIQNLLVFKSTSLLEPSLQGSLLKFRLIAVFIFSLMFLGSGYNSIKLLGVLLTFLSGILINYNSKLRGERVGIALTLLSTVAYAIVIIFYSKLLDNGFNAISLTFFIFLLPTILNLVLMPNRKDRIIKMTKTYNIKFLLTATTIGAIGNILFIKAVSLQEPTNVQLIGESALIITLAGEAIFLQESKRYLLKIAAVMLATIGSILIISS